MVRGLLNATLGGIVGWFVLLLVSTGIASSDCTVFFLFLREHDCSEHVFYGVMGAIVGALSWAFRARGDGIVQTSLGALLLVISCPFLLMDASGANHFAYVNCVLAAGLIAWGQRIKRRSSPSQTY